MKDTFFITTPIYYSNGIPHIGHAYSSFIADSIAKYKKISGKKIKFSTGVDENSQKVLEKANELGIDTMSYLDNMSEKHKGVWDGLNIKYTDFIRTSDSKHHEFVKTVLQKSFDKGDIYQGEYEGLYCVGCEGFKKDDDLVYLNKTTKATFPISKKVEETDNIIKVCPDHLITPDKIKEKNYFFKLSKYEKKLKEFYNDFPEFVSPADRFNEVKAFVNRGLEDFSISRETNKFGIKLPFDDTHVTYVWYDALFNYLTVCQEGDNMKFWPADLHVVGKDIIRFHAIYWPAMLMSAGYELPKQVLTTGFLTVEGQKISKSLGNAIDPIEFSEKYSQDMLKLYLLSSFNIGQDGDFDVNKAILTYNAKLANNFGNLVNRVVVLTLKLGLENGLNSNIPDSGNNISQTTSINNNGIKEFTETKFLINDLGFSLYNAEFNKLINLNNLKGSIDLTFKFLDELNTYTTDMEPWKTIKDESKIEQTKEILYTIAEGLRQVALNLYIFFPEKMGELFKKLGLVNYIQQLEEGELEKLRNKKEIFYITEKGDVLFKRIDLN